MSNVDKMKEKMAKTQKADPREALFTGGQIPPVVSVPPVVPAQPEPEEDPLDKRERKTYNLPLWQIESIRAYSLKEGLEISDAMAELLERVIPVSVAEDAKQRVLEGKVKTKKPRKRTK